MSIAVLSLLAGLCLGLCYIYQTKQQSRRSEVIQASIREKLERYVSYVASLEQRFNLVNRHVSYYVNSLSSEVSEAMMEMRRGLDAQKSLCAWLASRAKKCRDEELEELERQISVLSAEANSLAENPDSEAAEREQDKTCLKELFRRQAVALNWEESFEERLQFVGTAIYQASLAYQESMGLCASQDSRGTVADLSRAGIVEVLEAEDLG